jgi:hypothetical protein
MELIREIRSENPDKTHILKLITVENLKFFYENDCSLISEIYLYGHLSLSLESSIIHKILDTCYDPFFINWCGQTDLMCALLYYGEYVECDNSVFNHFLNMKCYPNYINESGETTLICAFRFYSYNINCDPNFLLKLLDMDCVPNQVSKYGDSALSVAFQLYSTNPNYEPLVFLKLILRLEPLITRLKLIDLMDEYTKDQNLKDKILGEYNYKIRDVLISSRLSRRDSSYIKN